MLTILDVSIPSGYHNLDRDVGDEDKTPLSETSEEEKIALLGRPRLGETKRCEVRIKESKEFKVDCRDL